jgi:hypothetical protein
VKTKNKNKKFASQQGTLAQLYRPRPPLSKILGYHPKKRTVQPEDAFQDTSSKVGFETG